jgi:hypothetical protein
MAKQQQWVAAQQGFRLPGPLMAKQRQWVASQQGF